MNPIWQDFSWAEELEEERIEYHLNIGEELIYAGLAYKYPGNNITEFYLNDVVKNYLSSEIKYEEGLNSHSMPNYFRKFTLSTDTIQTIPFYNNWSYDPNFKLSSFKILSDPIDCKIDRRQYLFWSYFQEFGSRIDLENNNKPITNWANAHIESGMVAILNLNDYDLVDGTLSIYCNSDRTNYEISCGDYVFYYVNKYGGWDSYLVSKNVVKQDTLARESYIKKTPNTEIKHNTINYLTEIRENWTLYTDYLTDEESKKLSHLVESDTVYLHNLETNEIVPVNITNSTYDYRTYRNNGNNKFYYTITCESAKNKYKSK